MFNNELWEEENETNPRWYLFLLVLSLTLLVYVASNTWKHLKFEVYETQIVEGDILGRLDPVKKNNGSGFLYEFLTIDRQRVVSSQNHCYFYVDQDGGVTLNTCPDESIDYENNTLLVEYIINSPETSRIATGEWGKKSAWEAFYGNQAFMFFVGIVATMFCLYRIRRNLN